MHPLVLLAVLVLGFGTQLLYVGVYTGSATTAVLSAPLVWLGLILAELATPGKGIL
jgi:hypothetical protein